MKRTLGRLAMVGFGLGTVGAQGVSMTVPGLGQMVQGDGVVRSMKCSGDAATITGNSNKLTLTGNCTKLSVQGNKNVVSVAVVGQIVATGNGNSVTWGKALRGSKPSITQIGNGNKITKK
ncbi:DUF3060 domain-containing protein [Deinococcus sp.]|uniref:DUF3060 domain-containing protein n=1 Tax=Deinococcus sp. TaxID=47478 RepID=UPI003CC69FF1